MEHFELDAEELPLLLGEDPPPEEIVAAQRRTSDRQLLARRAAAEKAFQPFVEAALASFRLSNPDLCAGLVGSGRADFRPAPTKGHGEVLIRLIQIILSPQSGTRTQQECRQLVEAEFPNHSVYRNWTKPLPAWALAKAKLILTGAAPPLSSLRLRAGTTLKDLHSAVKAALECKGTQARVVVAVTSEAVFVNGHRFKRTVNRAKGKEYSIVRLPIPALEAALQAKPKAS